MITVGDVLALPVFESVRLAAPCEGFAGRSVVNAGILDEEPPANGYKEFFPNEFILSSLGFARCDPALAERSIVSVMECGVAALAIKPAAQDAIGPRVIELSERRGIPILFYEGRYYEQILSSVLSLIRTDQEQSSKSRLIDGLVADRVAADVRASMYDIARATGATLQCFAVQPMGGDDCSLYAELSALSSVLASFRKDWGSVETAYACRYHDYLLAFVSYSRPPIDGRSHSEPDLIGRIEAMSSVRCGVSEEVPLGEGDLAVRQARFALEHAHELESTVVRWADLGVDAFHAAARADRLFARASALYMRELELHDQCNDTDLLATARAFADAFGDVRSAAEALYQHPNTVRYRLRKIKAVLGMPDSSDRELARFLSLVFL